MGLPRGASRSRLQKRRNLTTGCHGLAPWSLTLAATKEAQPQHRMPRACPVEPHARGYKEAQPQQDATGLAPWSLTLAAKKKRKLNRMPRACPVESHARCYK